MGGSPTRPHGGSGRRRRRHRHRSRSEFPRAVRPYGAAIIAVLVIGLGGVMVWLAVEYFVAGHDKRERPAKASSPAYSAQQVPAWEQDVLIAFDDAAQQAKAGNITGAEVQVDEAVAEMEEARVRSKAVPGDFFGRASSELDDILKGHLSAEPAEQSSDAEGSAQGAPADLVAGRLFQHVTQARIELAAMRSWEEPMPAGMLAIDSAKAAEHSAAQTAAERDATNGSVPDLPSSAPFISAAGKLKLPAGHIAIEAPRELSANQLLDPASVRGNFLDATLMPDTSEILLPPEHRQLSDNVRVEGLTMAGASQTLDGVHWRNVSFVGARLRYEDGPLDLQNVRFIHCTFGFPSDARGASIANAIVHGQTSLTIQ